MYRCVWMDTGVQLCKPPPPMDVTGGRRLLLTFLLGPSSAGSRCAPQRSGAAAGAGCCWGAAPGVGRAAEPTQRPSHLRAPPGAGRERALPARSGLGQSGGSGGAGGVGSLRSMATGRSRSSAGRGGHGDRGDGMRVPAVRGNASPCPDSGLLLPSTGPRRERGLLLEPTGTRGGDWGAGTYAAQPLARSVGRSGMS